jgi:hypothetical protein
MQPVDIEEYEEIGIMVMNGEDPKIDYIYNQIRKKAAKTGAKYVLDFALKCKKETRTTTRSKTDLNGNTTWVTETETVIAYTATGTLFSRRIK